MAQIPVPLIGKNVTSVTLTGQSVSANGTFSNGSSYNVSLKWQNVAYAINPVREEINAQNTGYLNEVIIAYGSSAHLEIYKVNDGTDPDVLFPLIYNYSYVLLQWVEGSASGSTQTFSYYGVLGEFQSGFQGRGKQIASLELGPCDIGSSPLTRVLT